MAPVGNPDAELFDNPAHHMPVTFTADRAEGVAIAARVSTSNVEMFFRNQSLLESVISTWLSRYQTAAADCQSAISATVAGTEADATSGTPQSLRTPPSTLRPPAGVADDAMDSNVSGVDDGGRFAVGRP